MGRKEITTKEDLMKVIELFENTGITYWLDGGWGVDILAGKQTRIHRDIDINFDAQHTEKLLNVLLNLGYKIDTDWKPVRIELYSDELGYLDIHPFVLNEDGTSKQADLEGGWYEFEKDYFGSVFFETNNKTCILNIICYHCQQAAEKYLKGFLVSKYIPFEKTHDLLK